MTSLVSSLSDYATHFSFSAFKNRATAFGSRFISLDPLPYENRIMTIVRNALEALAACIVVVTFALSLAPLSVGFFIYQILQAPSHYVIEGTNPPITQSGLRDHLKRLLRDQIKFNCLEIRLPISLVLNKEIFELIKKLRPRELILPLTASNDKLTENLESYSHFYIRRPIQASSSKPVCRLYLKEKIKHVVLPYDGSEMVEKLTRLANANERVERLYFLRSTPILYYPQIRKLVGELRPSFEVLIDNKDKHSPEALEAILKC